MQIINTNNLPTSSNIEQLDENTPTIISDIEEEEEEEKEEAEEETTLQQGSLTTEIGLKQKPGKKTEDMSRPSSVGTVPDTPSSTEDVCKQTLIDKSKKISKDNGIGARDKRHPPRQETFTMEAERKSESCGAKTSGWAISMELSCKLDLHDFIRSW